MQNNNIGSLNNNKIMYIPEHILNNENTEKLAETVIAVYDNGYTLNIAVDSVDAIILIASLSTKIKNSIGLPVVISLVDNLTIFIADNDNKYKKTTFGSYFFNMLCHFILIILTNGNNLIVPFNSLTTSKLIHSQDVVINDTDTLFTMPLTEMKNTKATAKENETFYQTTFPNDVFDMLKNLGITYEYSKVIKTYEL